MPASRSRPTTGCARLRPAAAASTCSRPANIWASASTAPAACRRCCGSCSQAGKLDGGCADRAPAGRIGENIAGRETQRPRGDPPLRGAAEGAGRLPRAEGQSVRLRDHEDQRDLRGFPQPLSLPAGHEGVFEARAIVFDGSDDYHHRINDPALDIDENCILVIRGAGPLGWPGSAEVVNMQPPDRADPARHHVRCRRLGDGRQSGTSDSPSILNASPESAAGGGLAWLRTGDTIRIDLNAGTCNALVDEAEIARRKAEPAAADPGEQHAVGGAVPREDRPAARRRGAGIRGQISRHRRRRRRGIITDGYRHPELVSGSIAPPATTVRLTDGC